MAHHPRRIPTSASAARKPFRDRARDGARGSRASSDDGATRIYQVPRELIEIARTRDQEAAGGTLTPLVPAPSHEMNAAVSAYTAPCSALRTRSDAVQALARELAVERGSASTRPPPERAHPVLRFCWISIGLALLVLLAYHVSSLLARL